MTVTTRIVPGKVQLHGMTDASIPEYVQAPRTSALHVPVIHIVLPKQEYNTTGETEWINIADFTNKYGNVFDPASAYYNPTALLVQQLTRGGQSTIGVRPLSANKKVSRVALSAFVQKVEVPVYERDATGRFKRDPVTGNKIPTGDTIAVGARVSIRPDPTAADLEPGGLSARVIPAIPATADDPAVPETHVFPLIEAIAGIGDSFNQGGLQIGVRPGDINFRGVSDFVKKTGIYPFEMRMFTENSQGARTFFKTTDRREISSFTFFDTVHNSVRYNLKNGFGAYTGKNVNRVVTARTAPFNDVIAYEESIQSLMQTLYVIESSVAGNNLLEDFEDNWMQMNPFTGVDHNGIPYHAIEIDPVIVWDLTGSVRSQYGVNPFYVSEGVLPSFVTPAPDNDPLGVMGNRPRKITPSQAWEINNKLMHADLVDYVASREQKDFARNRQSFFWDVGYYQEVKEAAVELLNARKDIIVALCATVFEPGKTNSVQEIYSRAVILSNLLKMYPESERSGTQAARGIVNNIEANLTDEHTYGKFSQNLDLAFIFARFAGNQAGTLIASRCPDSGENRLLTTMHSPNIEFEDDDVAADNFDIGCITLRPDGEGGFLRPALITITENSDSVMKDLVSVFIGVCIEKIAQDQWTLVTSDTTKSAEDYVAFIKDNTERKCRDRLGGLPRAIEIRPSYTEGVPGSRAQLNVEGHVWLNKGKYMMNFDLFMHNEQDYTG